MLRLTAAFILTIPVLVYSQSFSGQVYQLAESYMEDKCTVNPECDCCSSDLIFLSDSQFSMVARCIFNDIYYAGTYSVTAGKLTLKFKQTIVSEIIDEETSKINNKKQSLKINPIEFQLTSCGQKTRLRFEEGKDLENGSRRSPIDERKIIAVLKGKAAWKMVMG